MTAEPQAAAVPLEVSRLTPDRTADWDAFVEQAPEATFFHLSGWKAAVERAYGHDCPYLYATRDGRIVGVLPLTRIRSRLFGHALTSTAFAVYGGPVAETPDAADALIAAASDVADRHDVDHIGLRNLSPMAADGWQVKSDTHATFRKDISGDAEENLLAVPRKQRAVVRKSLQAGLQVDTHADTDSFFHLYATSVRNLGTPVFPKAWFQALRDVFGDRCEVLTVSHEGAHVASLMSFYFRNEVLPYYAGGTPTARGVGAHDFMYYDLMCRAGARGFGVFDFGRSKTGTGPYSFKKNFGFEPTPLHYAYKVRHGEGLPDVSPNNPKYRMMINIWSRLPLPIANLIGPRISRYLG